MPTPWLPISEIVSGLTLAAKLYNALAPNFGRLVRSKSDRFLNYDPEFLLRCYAHEDPVSNGITYAEVCDFAGLTPSNRDWNDSSVIITVAKNPFSLSSGKAGWQETSSAAFTELVRSGRISGNDSAIRVSRAKTELGTLDLRVQRATYHDQARSNLVLDFDQEDPGRYASLRSQLQVQYDHGLPDLNDRRLANTLGVAALLFYKSEGEWVPYIVRRVKRVAVFPGGWHCTASGVAKWPVHSPLATLEIFATRHMLLEIDEEVGLSRQDLIELRPLAFCREMSRGGKPQLIYGGFTGLDRKALAEHRKHARKVIEATNQWQEIEIGPDP